MTEQKFQFDDDKLLIYTPLPQYGADTKMYEVRLIMTKEIFQECYKRWIEPQESKG